MNEETHPTASFPAPPEQDIAELDLKRMVEQMIG